ncbi:hypothetical protein [Roseateles saccharophilus]|uniref:hypothetical protein n=1 Tax=Roseateles saccharophilus TaxID=304 RepID=UPI001FB2CE20|nr:hypothetical protein [Roseateles saccharophilus]
MNREDLEHIFRACSEITDQYEFMIVGSQSILGPIPNPPEMFTMSAKADIYPLNAPELADRIDAAIGEGSQFHETYGYYAQGVGPETATLPAGWARLPIFPAAAVNSRPDNDLAACCSAYQQSCPPLRRTTSARDRAACRRPRASCAQRWRRWSCANGLHSAPWSGCWGCSSRGIQRDRRRLFTRDGSREVVSTAAAEVNARVSATATR